MKVEMKNVPMKRTERRLRFESTHKSIPPSDTANGTHTHSEAPAFENRKNEE